MSDGSTETPPDIVTLDEGTIEQIAAGEVVDRPGSVVKELVENSLDAGASRIDVRVEDGGIERIVVRDDGVGMPPDGMRTAVRQHTTSKLRTIEDLQTGIESYGFRGEALHAIGTVAKLTITSRPHTAATDGYRVHVEGGKIVEESTAGCPVGTTVEVEGLFFNTPARREFLSTAQTEFDHVNRIVTHYALANPGVAVSLTHDGRDVFQTDGRGNLPAALLAVYGREVAESMLHVDTPSDAGPVERVHGYVSDPEVTRSRPRFLSTFVNGRFVRAKPIRDAIIAAYGNQLAPDRYPFAVIDCELDPAAIDVNVHPRKLEVRFDDPDAVETVVETGIAATLSEAGIIRSTAPRGTGRPAETDVTPSESGAEPLERGGGDAGTTSIPRTESPTSSADPTPSPRPRPDPSRKFSPSLDQETLDGSEPAPSYERLPPLRVLGQLHETFVVAEDPEGLVLIDQHAADERITYEQLRARVDDTADRQELMDPVSVSVTTSEAALFRGLERALSTLGFVAEVAEEGTVEVTAVPAILDRPMAPTVIRDAINAAVDDADPAQPIDAIADELTADLACHPSIKGGTILSDGSIVDLLERLDACENPYACPHGRPVLIRIDEDELAERFERTYPGHAERRRD